METMKVGSTRQINTRQKESGRLWQGRFFDRALRTVQEYEDADLIQFRTKGRRVKEQLCCQLAPDPWNLIPARLLRRCKIARL